MPSYELLFVCISAIVVVFFLLAMLALVMRLIMAVFPEKILQSDSAYVAAIASVMSTLFPGTKITKVEEIK
ncbi:MAG: hypothetical protein JSV52_10535 [Candidatus Zixiibacteriota bacterium]|nr:MAG: hypothetical protein JSV52_10535 [candidate division Zixibacteria bacterium]